ncbi:MAG: hypothetical protein ACFFE5_06260, partial [Candidatus Thorarchaeota archaeon]
DWKVNIIENNENEISVSVERCIFCSEIGVPCDLFKGFLFNSLQKSLPFDYRVIYERDLDDINNPSHNSFIVKLRIDKNIK